VCDWWLTYIEKEVDAFLCRHGYVENSIPPDYTDTPPSDLAVVSANLHLLEEIMKGESLEFVEFVQKTTTDVYVVLHKLIDEMKFVIDGSWVIHLGNMVLLSEKERDHLVCDWEYLLEMKKMDAEVEDKRSRGIREEQKVEMTAVVPVAGLVVARFHICACELRTAIDIWRPKEPIQPIIGWWERKRGCGEDEGRMRGG
jgi:hypothetical protein